MAFVDKQLIMTKEFDQLMLSPFFGLYLKLLSDYSKNKIKEFSKEFLKDPNLCKKSKPKLLWKFLCSKCFKLNSQYKIPEIIFSYLIIKIKEKYKEISKHAKKNNRSNHEMVRYFVTRVTQVYKKRIQKKIIPKRNLYGGTYFLMINSFGTKQRETISSSLTNFQRKFSNLISLSINKGYNSPKKIIKNFYDQKNQKIEESSEEEDGIKKVNFRDHFKIYANIVNGEKEKTNKDIEYLRHFEKKYMKCFFTREGKKYEKIAQTVESVRKKILKTPKNNNLLTIETFRSARKTENSYTPNITNSRFNTRNNSLNSTTEGFARDRILKSGQVESGLKSSLPNNLKETVHKKNFGSNIVFENKKKPLLSIETCQVIRTEGNINKSTTNKQKSSNQLPSIEATQINNRYGMTHKIKRFTKIEDFYHRRSNSNYR